MNFKNWRSPAEKADEDLPKKPTLFTILKTWLTNLFAESTTPPWPFDDEEGTKIWQAGHAAEMERRAEQKKLAEEKRALRKK